jgi:hypothetical protein
LPAPDPSKKIAVILSSAYGAEITDTLPNFEILADSGAFNVYSVAPERTVLPLVSQSFKATSLDFIPHFSYAEYESQIGRDPDLIVIPGIPWYTPERDAAMVDWIRAHAGPRTTVPGDLRGWHHPGGCGLLDGHTATTNAACSLILRRSTWHDLGAQRALVRRRHDGRIDHAHFGHRCHVARRDRFAGQAKALAVARQISYTNTAYLDDPSWPWPSEQWPTPSRSTARITTLITTGVAGTAESGGVPLFDARRQWGGPGGLLGPTTGSLNFRRSARDGARADRGPFPQWLPVRAAGRFQHGPNA